jgi:ATP/maltotriose-dependent transcriptional regulator MalT
MALMIDDFHVIGEESVHQTVEYLIDRLPPSEFYVNWMPPRGHRR